MFKTKSVQQKISQAMHEAMQVFNGILLTDMNGENALMITLAEEKVLERVLEAIEKYLLASTGLKLAFTRTHLSEKREFITSSGYIVERNDAKVILTAEDVSSSYVDLINPDFEGELSIPLFQTCKSSGNIFLPDPSFTDKQLAIWHTQEMQNFLFETLDSTYTVEDLPNWVNRPVFLQEMAIEVFQRMQNCNDGAEIIVDSTRGAFWTKYFFLQIPENIKSLFQPSKI